jgi:hypothetical protein
MVTFEKSIFSSATGAASAAALFDSDLLLSRLLRVGKA